MKPRKYKALESAAHGLINAIRKQANELAKAHKGAKLFKEPHHSRKDCIQLHTFMRLQYSYRYVIIIKGSLRIRIT